MSKLQKSVVIIAMSALVCGTSLALSIPVGSSYLSGAAAFRDTNGNGIYAPDGGGALGWSSANGGFKISWNIVYNAGDTDWDYSYTISNEDGGAVYKGLGHWILQISNAIPGEGESLEDYIYDGDGPFSGIVGAETWSDTGPGNSNPDMPASIYGIKFDEVSGEGIFTFTFSSTQQPVWGDFYAKDGVDRPKNGEPGYAINVTAWNTGLDPANGFVLDEDTSDFTPWIPTPDTEQGAPPQEEPIPEPATLALLGVGLAVAAIRKRSRK